MNNCTSDSLELHFSVLFGQIEKNRIHGEISHNSFLYTTVCINSMRIYLFKIEGKIELP